MRCASGLKSVAGIGLLVGAATSQAGVIDFTSSDWAGIDAAPQKTTFSVGNTEAKSDGGYLTFNGGDNGSTCGSGSPGGVFGLACIGDGLGITDDELNGNNNGESLDILFTKATFVRQIALLDLFVEGTGSGETATFSIFYESADGQAEGSAGFTGTVNRGDFGPNVSDGFYLIDLADVSTMSATIGVYDGSRKVSRIEFDAPFDGGVSDFAVAGIVTPLPAAVWLFGSALFGLAGFGRWRRRNAAA